MPPYSLDETLVPHFRSFKTLTLHPFLTPLHLCCKMQRGRGVTARGLAVPRVAAFGIKLASDQDNRVAGVPLCGPAAHLSAVVIMPTVTPRVATPALACAAALTLGGSRLGSSIGCSGSRGLAVATAAGHHCLRHKALVLPLLQPKKPLLRPARSCQPASTGSNSGQPWEGWGSR